MDIETRPKAGGARPVLIVVGTLLAVFALTFAIYSVGDYREDAGGFASNLAGESAASACGQGTPADSTYTLDASYNPDPPRPEGTTVFLTVRHNGQPVTGAKVCTFSDMPDMQHPGLSKVTTEASSGRYEARIQFGMGGAWRMGLVIAEPNQPIVTMPLKIQVAEIS